MEQLLDERLPEVCSRVPMLSKFPFEDLTIERIGGLTNRDYRVDAGDDSYVLRVPGEGTEEYIDRAADEQAGRVTSDIGVNAELVYYELETGQQRVKS